MTRHGNTSTTLLSEQLRRHAMIMVVDDEKDVRESVCEMLEARGYEVVSAEDGRAALDHLRGGCRPHVILLDLMMPGMNGWQFREEQRQDPSFAHIPVVVITATRNLRQIQADEIVHKPIRPEQLLQVVDRWSALERPAPVAAAGSTTDAIRPAARTEPVPIAAAEVADRSALFSDRFIEMLGHDLRNPLSAISITGGLLRYHAKEPELVEPTERVLAIVDRMDLMIGHLLDFMRIALGRSMPIERRSVDLRDVCDNVVRTLARASGREINVTVTGEMNGVWDRDRLEMLISTLVADAFDHDQSGAPIQVIVDGSNSDTVHIEVLHGGINTVDLLSKTLEQRDSGQRSDIEEECTRLGLGMYVAQQIVKAHGGQMSTNTGSESGTRFDITLPRNP